MTAAVGGEVGATRIGPWGGAVVAGVKATEAEIVDCAAEVEVVAPQGGRGTWTRPGERTTRKALWERRSRPETF